MSTDKQADHGVSLDAQRVKVDAYAGLYDLEIAEVIIDAGVSAKTLDRPGLARALSALESGRAAALLVVKLDRLTRSVRDLDTLIQRYFARPDGPALLSVSEQIDTRSAAGRLVLNVLAAVSQWEREAISERTSAAMRHLADQGRYTGGRPPYGYRASSAGELVPVPDEQAAIEAAVRARARGLSLRQVGACLLEEGHAPRNGGTWAPTQVKRLVEAGEASGSVPVVQAASAA